MSESFRLPPQVHARIYSEQIEPAMFLGTTAAESPRIVVVAGQPGAGKTKVVELTKKEFEDQSVVVVNTDKLRPFHPQIKEINKLDDKRSAERTHEDASDWSETLLRRCMETNRNVILEGVFKDKKKLAALIMDFKSSGYEVVVRFVAVHRRHSVLGVHSRNEREKIARGYGRYVPLAYHDVCYEKVLDSAATVEEQAAADCIEVFNREGECLYRNENGPKGRKTPVGARAAIERERARELSKEQRHRYGESWERVIEYMEQRHAPPKEIGYVKVLAETFIAELGD